MSTVKSSDWQELFDTETDTGPATAAGTVEGLRQAVIALVEQQALANRIALGDFDRDELLKLLDA